MIISANWHNELYCPIRDGVPGGKHKGLGQWTFLSFLFPSSITYMLCPLFTNIILGCGCASPFCLSNLFPCDALLNKDDTVKNINLVNAVDLNRILRFEIFVHTNVQLCAANMILKFTPISTHVIKAHDPHVTRIDWLKGSSLHLLQKLSKLSLLLNGLPT